MKPEPLKNKIKSSCYRRDMGHSYDEIYIPDNSFEKDDIKSACEWLKKQYNDTCLDDTEVWFKDLVEIAFKDVYKQ